MRIALTLYATALMVAAPAAAENSVAVEFHGGPTHAGVFAGAGPEGFFKLAWRFAAGHQVVASPVIAKGVLYIGAKNGEFYALDAARGVMRWRFKADAAITSTAAFADGVLYFISDANTIYALRADDGQELWRTRTGRTLAFDAMVGFSMAQEWDYWSSSPLVLAGRVYVGGGDGRVYALAAKTGRIIWSHRTAGRVHTAPASDGRLIFAGNLAGEMVALDAKSGAVSWSFHTRGNATFPAGSIQSSPTLADGLVLFGARDYNLYALDAGNGREVWRQPVKGSWVPSTPAVRGGRVFVGTADGRALFAFDVKTGDKLWSADLDNLVFSSPVIADGNGTVYIATMGGTVFALRAADGKIVGYTLTQDRVLSTPWIASGLIYFGDNDGYVYAFGAGPQRFPGG